MSEYQYYEFQAIDRPLTEPEMRELRSYSTRATITATRFVNHYEYGSFKGNPAAWMEKYFDAYLHLANWSTHELMFRLPCRLLDLAAAKQYCRGETATARGKGDFVILEFSSVEEEGGDWDDDGRGWLSSLIPLRSDLMSGDLRTLYLAWLLRLAGGQEVHLRVELLKTFRASRKQRDVSAIRPRTVGELFEEADRLAESRKRRKAEQQARERMRREQEAAEAREKHLANLARREPEAWQTVDTLIATKRPQDYDAAVGLLKDLADLGEKRGRQAEVRDRLARLRQEHARKATLIHRLKTSGLLVD